MPTETRRAKQLWKRFTQIYGARFLEQFGKEPPEPWVEAVDALRDEQIAFGLSKVTREHVQHPPALGAFQQACMSLPTPKREGGPTIQEQLCEYAALHTHDMALVGEKMTLVDYSLPWTYVYREWRDETQSKGLERCAECIGLVIDLGNGRRLGWSVNAMLMDHDGHARALRNFRPGPLLSEAQMAAYRNPALPEPGNPLE